MEAFECALVALNINPKIQHSSKDVPTQWNATYLMIKLSVPLKLWFKQLAMDDDCWCLSATRLSQCSDQFDQFLFHLILSLYPKHQMTSWVLWPMMSSLPHLQSLTQRPYKPRVYPSYLSSLGELCYLKNLYQITHWFLLHHPFNLKPVPPFDVIISQHHTSLQSFIYKHFPFLTSSADDLCFPFLSTLRRHI
jgi:hypothetical protein